MSKTIDALHTLMDNAILSKPREERNYLGGSQLGESCDRALWYSYHKKNDSFDARRLRIFDTGHGLEDLMIKWLELAGLKLFTRGKDGKQFEFNDGAISGHPDGVILGIPNDETTPYLLEIKTSNDHKFKTFVKDGFCSDEKYCLQVHVYMYKFKLKKCLAMVLNKNTQDIYFEIIELDEFTALAAIERGKTIIDQHEMPDRKYETKSYFKCRLCNYNKECWQ